MPRLYHVLPTALIIVGIAFSSAEAAAPQADEAVAAPTSEWQVSDTNVTLDALPIDGVVAIDAWFYSTEGLTDDEGLAVVSAQITGPDGVEVAGEIGYLRDASLLVWKPAASLAPETSYGGAITFQNTAFQNTFSADILVQVAFQTTADPVVPLSDLTLVLDGAIDNQSACCADGESCELPPTLTVGWSAVGGQAANLVTVSGAMQTGGSCLDLGDQKLRCDFPARAAQYCVDVTTTSVATGDSLSETLCIEASAVVPAEARPCPTAPDDGCRIGRAASDSSPAPALLALSVLGLGLVVRRRRAG